MLAKFLFIFKIFSADLVVSHRQTPYCEIFINFVDVGDFKFFVDIILLLLSSGYQGAIRLYP